MSLGKTFRLNTGATIPAVGFGTFVNENAKGESYKSAKCALEAGYRWVHPVLPEMKNCLLTLSSRVDGKKKQTP
jgi:hypothetical protein